jgi:antitoxin ParD1/3/4
MASMNISLPDTLRLYIEERVTNDGYGNVSEFIRELIREDQKRQVEARLEKLLLEGLNSGEPIEVTPEYFAKKKQQLLEKQQTKVRKQ